jgi:hypothetical protein
MRLLVIGALVAAIAGCGGESKPATAVKPAQARTAPQAKEVVYLYRVQGDDPWPDEISLRTDGTAELNRGGGHSGITSYTVELPRAFAEHATRLAAQAPWKRMEGRTVEPGGFGGWDNDVRYMLRRGDATTTLSSAHLPRSMRPLITALNAVIEGDVGRKGKGTHRSSISGTIAP